MSAAVSGDTTVFVVSSTAIGEMIGSPAWGPRNWATKNVRPRGATIDTHLRSPAEVRSPFSGTANFLDNNATQDESVSGVIGLCYSGTLLSFEVRGPNYSARVRDHLLMSGFFTSFDVTEGEAENQRELAFTFQPSGVEELNGTVKGSAT